jgi:hypothetical protein
MTDFDEAALAVVRRAYARQMLAIVGVEDAALEEAFAMVPRALPRAAALADHAQRPIRLRRVPEGDPPLAALGRALEQPDALPPEIREFFRPPRQA